MAQDSVTFKRPEYEAHEHQFTLCNQIYNGIDTAKELILKTPNEQNQDFTARIEKASLNNYVERIVTTMAGQIFRKPVTYNGINPTLVADYLETTDKNVHFNQFGKELTESAILNGKAFVLVDIPMNGGDPYFSLVKRPQLINWRKDEEGNFTMAVIAESYLDESGRFSIEVKEQYRVILPDGNIEIWRQSENAETGWTVEEITTSYNFVPLFELDAGDVPPLYDIAKMNVNYLNSFSKKDQYLDTAGSPIPFFKGSGLNGDNDIFGDDDAEQPSIILGVNSVVLTDNPEAELKWVEMSGGSIEALQNDLDRKEKAMTEQALIVMSESTKTATQTQSEKEESASRLSDIAEDCENTLNKAFDAWHVMKYGTNAKGTIEVNRDFNLFVMDSGLLTGLTQLQVSGNLSKETLLRSLVKHEIVDIEDIELEIKRINDEIALGEPIE